MNKRLYVIFKWTERHVFSDLIEFTIVDIISSYSIQNSVKHDRFIRLGMLIKPQRNI